MQYIDWLNERVRELHRVLKPTGSLFLHCDWHADAEIKLYILDKLFGKENFRAEIVWLRTSAHSDAKNKLGVINDAIYYYTKSDKATYNPVYISLKEKHVESKYTLTDEKGIYRLSDMSAPMGGGMSAINKSTGRPNGWYEYKGYRPPTNGWRYKLETMENLDEEGRIHFPKNKDGSPAYEKRLQLKRYLHEQKGELISNVWFDIPNVNPASKERIGYPTQKPVALLERIIAMASHEGDVVLDPFVGGGTTVVAAERLKRRWLGIDQSVQAVKVTELRLLLGRDLFSPDFAVRLHKYDVEALKAMNAYAFEGWLVTQFGGTPNAKRRGDLGLDGTSREGLPLQVKQSEGVGRNVVDNFRAAAERYDAALFARQRAAGEPVGYVLAFSFGKGAVEEVARLRTKEGIRIELKQVKDIVELAHKPRLTVAVAALAPAGAGGKRAVQFTAHGESPAGLEFYAWDTHHDPAKGFRPDVLLDKAGVQTFQLRPGAHTIAVQVVDNDGLSALEVVRLHVNGDVTVQ